MRVSSILVVLTILVVTVCAAPSNSTTSKKPTPPSRSTTTSVATSSAKPSRSTSTTKKPSTPSGAKKPTANASLLRIRRDHDDNNESAHGVVAQRSPASLNSTTHTKSSPANSTRHVRSSQDEDEDISTHAKDTQTSVPSNHPLFGTRTSSNITSALRPKLRTPSKDKPSSSDSSSSDEDKATDPQDTHTSSHHHIKATSQEETVSVSTGPVGFSGRNSTSSSSVKGFASGTNKRAPAKKPEAEVEKEEEDLLFII